MKRAILIGGPRDGVEIDVERRARTVNVPLPAGPPGSGEWATAIYDSAAVRVAGTFVGEVFVYRGERLTRQRAVRAIDRLYLAGLLR